MKILLINPSVRLGSQLLSEEAISGNLINYLGEFQPLGLLYIASSLRQQGYNDLDILDAQAENLTSWQAADKAARLNPQVIGIYCLTFSFIYVLELARALKKKTKALIIVGGPHLSLYPREVLSHTCFDFGISGEGEHVFAQLLNLLKENQSDKITGLAGVVYRKDNAVLANPAQIILDLDSLPLPARDLLPQKKYFRNYRNNRFTSLISARGCPYKCIYCSHVSHYNAIRFCSPQRVVQEMRECQSRFGSRCFQFFDDTFLLNKARALEICRLIKEKLPGIEYLISTRVDLLDEELAMALSDSGCNCISLGVESADQGVLDYLRKEITVDQSSKAIQLCKKYNIDSVIFIMVGVPIETKQSLKNTLDFIKNSKPRWLKTNVFVPYPGSPVYEQLIRDGKITDFWATMTLTGAPPQIPNVCKNFTKVELKNICNQFNLIPYLRSGSNFFNFRKLANLRNVIWSGRWFLKLVFNLLQR